MGVSAKELRHVSATQVACEALHRLLSALPAARRVLRSSIFIGASGGSTGGLPGMSQAVRAYV